MQNKFGLLELKMTNLSWSATILIENTFLEEIKNKYNIKLVFNIEPYEDAIKEAELEKLKSESKLLPDDINWNIEIQRKKDKRDKAIVEHPDIDFISRVMEVKYDPKGTKLKFRITDEAVVKLNDKKGELYKYFIELIELENGNITVNTEDQLLETKSDEKCETEKLKGGKSYTRSSFKKTSKRKNNK